MLVFGDTTVLRHDFRLTSPVSRVFLEGLRSADSRLCVSEVVIAEAVNLFRVAVTELARSTQHQLERLVRLVPGPEYPPQRDLGEAATEYRKYLLNLIRATGGEVLPYGSIPHDQIVPRAISKEKPFSESGSGYRDFLIWMSVVERAQRSNDDVAFISGNTSDFCDGDELHGTLLRDLDARGIRRQRFRHFRSVEDFNTRIIKPLLTTLEELRRRLVEDKTTGATIVDNLSDRLLEQLRYEDDLLVNGALGLPGSSLSARVSKLEKASIRQVRNVTALDTRTASVELRLAVSAEVCVDFDREQYLRYPEVRQYVGTSDDGDSEWWTATARIPESLLVDLELLVDAQTLEVAELQVTDIQRDR